ncbi:MAG TPA: gliding motility-associated ABC transporter permease subunit GldF [Flavobacteriaceae bacterium]|jgi:ABC-2 type transport system permease protein|nr:gliding motility-associated ABC transporter permease subunit GldF [Flavobacteriaceae bacterium]
MWALVKREWYVYFSSPLGYLILGLFLTLSTLFLWFLDTEYNLLNAGFADLNAFFVLGPWLLLILIPALSMRSFSDELRLGTLELLLTKPLSLWQILLGKYLAGLSLLLAALLPTVVYFFAVNALKLEDSPVDWGSTLMSYWGLFCVGASYMAMGIFSSLISRSQVSAFLLAIALCFVQFYVWKAVADLQQDEGLYRLFNSIGIFEHYLNFRQGVLRLKDVVYFIGLNYLLLYLGKWRLNQIKNH